MLRLGIVFISKQSAYITALLLVFSSNSAFSASQWVRFVPDSQQGYQAFVRVTNMSDESGEVSILGRDEEGNQSATTMSFTLPANGSVNFNSDDIRQRNSSKGITGSLGSGYGSWQLKITSNLELKVMGLFRTSAGFVNQVHDKAVLGSASEFFVPFFNPASNSNQVSLLRISNLTTTEATVSIVATDDSGNRPSDLSISVLPLNTVEISSQDLENGNSSIGLVGEAGDGEGKWNLRITSDQEIEIVNLLETPGGYLSNLSSANESDSNPNRNV